MGNKFSEFNPNQIKSDDKEKQKINVDNNVNIESLYNKYSTYNKSELMQEFLKLSQSKKSKGELREDSIDAYRKALYPYLTDEQKTTFESLMKVVK